MFAAQRLEKIREVLISEKTVEVAALSSLLNVSDVTVRKDLDKLAEEGFLVKTHGGAILVEKDANKMAETLKVRRHKAKEDIAKTAVALIDANDAIYVGPGSTCYLLHSYLKKMPEVTVVTSNVSLAVEIMGHVKKTYLLNGEMRAGEGGTMYTMPYDTSSELDGLFCNQAFLSADGFDLQAGLSYNEIMDFNFMKGVPRLCKKTNLLVDSGKFGKVALYNLRDTGSISCVVTDQCDDKRYTQMLFDNNIKFLIANQLWPN